MSRASRPEGMEKSAVVADDDEFFRMALSQILTGRLNFHRVVETGSFDDALERLEEEKRVDIAFFDLAMPGMHSAANLRSVRELFPNTRVVVVSGSQRRDDILTALEAGVHGYVPKGLGVEDLSHALNLILEGLIFVPSSLPDLPPSLINEPARRTGPTKTSLVQTNFAALTPRQQDVLRLIVSGMSNKEIARALSLGEGTIKVHLAALFRSLGVKSRAAAAVVGAQMIAESEGKGGSSGGTSLGA